MIGGRNMVIGGLRETAYHPSVGLFMTCDHCDWSYGFVPPWRAYLAAIWHWVRC